ncbi:Heterokaryon incompatibility s [Fusarium albosuccineum]|uniref:Heterokaryon incompatibility s n=1 Tax=Fusarium albosuccineum TaxID=1237068 RepID=A0A8H4LDI9_9HYPO|nr:Heterokaryon incompatibility s [Fusarium albosuccineum]
MEVAGLALSLVSTTSVIIEGLGYIRLARSFPSDYSRYQLKIDLLRLRIARWQTAIEDAVDDLTEHERSVAMRTLEDMAYLLKRSEKLGLRHAQGMTHGGEKGAVQAWQEDDLEPESRRAHAILREVINNRSVTLMPKEKPNMARRMFWAINDKPQFEKLIQELEFHTINLEQMISDEGRALRAACLTQARSIKSKDTQDCQSLNLLMDVNQVDGQPTDSIFAEIGKSLAMAGSHSFSTGIIRAQSNVMMGNRFETGFRGGVPRGIRGHNYNTNVIEGSASVSMGDWFRGEAK